MYIFKQPHIGGDVCPHQDGSYIHTTPQSVTGMWFALDNCDIINGCLFVVPGSHISQGVKRLYRRKHINNIEDQNNNENNNNKKTEYYPIESENFDLSNSIPVVVNKGALVILHHALVHYSNNNTSNLSRHAYTIHIIDGSDGIIYDKDNWLQRDTPFNEII